MTVEEREQRSDERNDQKVQDLRGEAIVAIRAVHAIGAGVIIFGLAMLLGTDEKTAKEVALLTGPIAYFSAELGDRIGIVVAKVFSGKR